MSPEEQNIIQLLVILFCTLAVFLVTREIVMWYWKINARLQIQERMLSELTNIKKQLQILNKEKQ